MSTSHSLRCLAVMFRVNDPNIGHCTVLDEMEDAGLAYVYGLYRSIHRRHWHKRSVMAERIATELERLADKLEIRHLANG